MLELCGREVLITNPDKVVFPDAGHTKFDLVHYYLSVDVIPAMVSSGGVLRVPAGYRRLAAILRDDVAAAAAAVLTAGSHDGRTYDLTGPDAFTQWHREPLAELLPGRRRPGSVSPGSR